ncbi:General stress protein 69 [Labrenzia sp. THAF35]|uniref:aldo/keto reductase n=1 Tax=Labrenzia sp. THAF35 TaxID=2587854 RepID=UPI0012680146|nr:aldo/keto reductase [Labrenzia sp. THAF35]QFT67744.1 General stress protein 69 [Labrenzia sp. THAF35]
MDRRWLGDRALSVPVLSLGTASFTSGPWSGNDAGAARRLVDICLDEGLNMFDTADVYAGGNAEMVLGQAINGRRDKVIISTKAGLRTGAGEHDVGSSRGHLLTAVEGMLSRLRTDYIDLFQLHAFDAMTPVEETMEVLDDLVKAGKVRHLGVSNYAGWQLMKSQAAARYNGWQSLVAHQVYYSLIGRDYEFELMPLGLDQGVSALVWSPLGWGRLKGGGKHASAGRHKDATPDYAPPLYDETLLERVLAALGEVARDTGKSEAQVALNWLLQRPTVASLIIGVSSEAQLRNNMEATGWELAAEHMRLLDEASTTPVPYPYWHQRAFPERNPQPV